MTKRILFPFEGDTVIGGSHVSAMKLAAGLDRSKYEPYILVHYQDGLAGEYARSLGLEYEVLERPSLMSPGQISYPGDCKASGYLFKSVPQFISVLNRIRPDIVHTNEGRMHANWALPTKLSGRKHIWHHRQDPTAFGINKLAPVLSDHIISVSHFSKPSKPVRSVDSRFTVVRSPFDFNPNPPDPAKARQDVLAEMGLPDNALLLGYFGNFVPRKRPDHFAQAVAAVQKQMPDIPVHGFLFGSVVDRGNDLDKVCLNLMAETGLESQIHMMGFRQPIEGYMAAMDANLVTALDEPFGRTLIESMYLGTPVVAARHGGNVEAIVDGDNGFLVDPFDAGAYAAPIIRMHQDKTVRDHIIAAGQRHARDNFGMSIHIDSVCRIYDQLLT